MSKQSIDEQVKNFEAWLSEIPETLMLFYHLVPKNIVDKLDYSLESLNVLERHLLDTYEHYEDIIREGVNVVDCYAVYIGETFRKVLKDRTPNKWELMLDEYDLYYELIVIRIGSFRGCPMTLVTACLNRRQGNYLSEILQTVLDEWE